MLIFPLLYYSCTSDKVDTDDTSKSDKMFKLIKDVAKGVKIHLIYWDGIVNLKVKELTHYLMNVFKDVLEVLEILLYPNSN